MYETHPFVMGWCDGEGNFPKMFLLRNYIKCPDMYKQLFFKPKFYRGMIEWHAKTFFARNFMKYPDLHRKVMYGTHAPLG